MNRSQHKCKRCEMECEENLGYFLDITPTDLSQNVEVKLSLEQTHAAKLTYVPTSFVIFLLQLQEQKIPKRAYKKKLKLLRLLEQSKAWLPIFQAYALFGRKTVKKSDYLEWILMARWIAP